MLLVLYYHQTKSSYLSDSLSILNGAIVTPLVTSSEAKFWTFLWRYGPYFQEFSVKVVLFLFVAGYLSHVSPMFLPCLSHVSPVHRSFDIPKCFLSAQHCYHLILVKGFWEPARDCRIRFLPGNTWVIEIFRILVPVAFVNFQFLFSIPVPHRTSCKPQILYKIFFSIPN